MDTLSRTLREFHDRAAPLTEIVDRLMLLQEFANREVQRAHWWGYQRIRRKHLRVRRGRKCWACQWRSARVQHHIVQVQYGGGNGRRCVVPLCHGCHAVVHPWLRDSQAVT